MSGFFPSLDERNPINVLRAIQDLFRGRSNAFGSFTLEADETSTVVAAPNCGPDSCITLMPLTASAKAAPAYIAAADVVQGQFTVTHDSDSATDRSFRYAIQG